MSPSATLLSPDEIRAPLQQEEGQLPADQVGKARRSLPAGALSGGGGEMSDMNSICAHITGAPAPACRRKRLRFMHLCMKKVARAPGAGA